MSARRIVLAILFAGLATPAFAQNVEYYHLDALGSVRAVSNEAGVVIERHDYLPFGEECTTGACAANASLPGSQPRQYTTKERDTETGLDYFGARYYSDKTARFTTLDPVYTWSENLVDPQRWNRYAYVRNNPLRYTDPDGQILFDFQEFKANLTEALHFGQSGHGYLVPTVAGIAAIGSVASDALLVAGGTVNVIRAVAREAAKQVVAQKGESGRRGVDFVVTRAGEAIPVPTGATGPNTVRNGKGFTFEGGAGGHGLDPRTANVRIMDPVGAKGNAPAYPGGRVTYTNRARQGVNPSTGRTVSNSDPSRHYPLKP